MVNPVGESKAAFLKALNISSVEVAVPLLANWEIYSVPEDLNSGAATADHLVLFHRNNSIIHYAQK